MPVWQRITLSINESNRFYFHHVVTGMTSAYAGIWLRSANTSLLMSKILYFWNICYTLGVV